MRLAFVSPLPPAPTGVADYAADVLALLAAEHEIEAFHAQPQVARERLPPSVRVRHADQLTARHRQRRFDLAVHQLGNNPAHAFVYDALARLPGLLVLHDLVLFHARAAAFTDSEAVRAWRRDPASASAREAARPSLEAWREELAYSHPEAGGRLFAAHLGTVGELLPYAYPLLRIPLEASRAVLVHSAHAASLVLREQPQAAVLQVPLPLQHAPVADETLARLRARLGFDRRDVVVGCYGLATREKRVGAVAAAVAAVIAQQPSLRLRLLVTGEVPQRAALAARLVALGLGERAVLTGRVPADELDAHVRAADLVVHLRWPTGRETSAALLRVLAHGRPTIVSDLQHQSDLPPDAVWRIDPAREGDLAPAIAALAGDPAARRRLGEAAAAWARKAHAPALVAEGWRRALELARARPDPPPRPWPGHWPRPEPAARSRA